MTAARLPWLKKPIPARDDEQPTERCMLVGHDPATNLAGEVKCLDCGVVLSGGAQE